MWEKNRLLLFRASLEWLTHRIGERHEGRHRCVWDTDGTLALEALSRYGRRRRIRRCVGRSRRAALAQVRLGDFGRFGGPPPRRSSTQPNVPYDGRFTFVRVSYETAPGGYWWRGQPSWAHGYPTGRAEPHARS